jgi:hypothetical protein
MADQFVKDFIGHRVSFGLVNEAGQWHGILQEVGEQWVKVIVGKGKMTLIPIVNIRSLAIELEGGDASVNQVSGS